MEHRGMTRFRPRGRAFHLADLEYRRDGSRGFQLPCTVCSGADSPRAPHRELSGHGKQLIELSPGDSRPSCGTWRIPPGRPRPQSVDRKRSTTAPIPTHCRTCTCTSYPNLSRIHAIGLRWTATSGRGTARARFNPPPGGRRPPFGPGISQGNGTSTAWIRLGAARLRRAI